ncbi:MAG: type II toxin-antitoxin system VapC family toxin [Candidatus Dormibacteraceae bacterium]
MIGYLDTSAVIPLLVVESSSVRCRRFWDDLDGAVASRLLYVEAVGALARAHRAGRLSFQSYGDSLQVLDQIWSEVTVIEVSDSVVRRAAMLASQFGLRGYDAVHCACAEQIEKQDIVAASGDKQLLGAWAALGIDTFDSNADFQTINLKGK